MYSYLTEAFSAKPPAWNNTEPELYNLLPLIDGGNVLFFNKIEPDTSILPLSAVALTSNNDPDSGCLTVNTISSSLEEETTKPVPTNPYKAPLALMSPLTDKAFVGVCESVPHQLPPIPTFLDEVTYNIPPPAGESPPSTLN